MYDKVSTDLNFVEREKEVSAFWKRERIFERSMEERKNGPTFTFYDGPPTANGKPHIGHVITRVIKDLIPRYRTMKGYYVPRKAGWDTHGLPVELEIEKELGINGKDQIEAYGLDPFIRRCRESVWKYKEMWEKFSDSVGFWADMEHPYVTYHDDFIESEWWALKTIWDKRLLYKGFKIVPYCPRCGTPLSSHEVAQGYKTVKERSAVVRFKAADEDAYFLAWTTTPWTLPSNVALCVNPDEIYCKVKAADGYVYYLAEALLDAVLGRLAGGETPAYEVLSRCTGRELEYRKYEPLFDFVSPLCEKQHKKAHYVTCDGYVTMEDGTGIVHIAPAFGEDDAKVGRDYDLPFIQLVDGKGRLTAETPYAGQFVKDADPKILADLDARGLLFDAPKFEHDYPFCWRCETPLIYYARDSWFIRMTAVRDDLIRNNNTVRWIPESIGKGRFGDWLENIQDWGVSRNRYWGTPLNIWECECGHMEAIGSRAELFKRSGMEEAKTVELHRPYIDAITMPCPCCGRTMHRVPEVIDCWFDSGAMPFAQHHYPFENKDLFAQQFPAAFISEAVDQTRGWFYSLLAESTLLFNRAPYETVLVLGHVLDETGQKMSKSRGNAIEPMDALEKHGADAIRWYFCTNSAPWLPTRFYDEAVVEGQRRFMGTLWNTYAFFVLYANIDGFDPTRYALDYGSLNMMDKWLLSKLNTLIQKVDGYLDQYKIPEAAGALADFVDELSNWYVRRGRERYWAKGMEQDKINAYLVLYEALVSLSKLSAPFIPFMAEQIYRNLVCSVNPKEPVSVHLCLYPEADASKILPDLEREMEDVLRIVGTGRAARNAAGIKNRQPLGVMYVKAPGGPLNEECAAIVADELNVKKVLFTDDVQEFTAYSFKPQLRTVGPKYGRLAGRIREFLAGIDGNEAMAQLKSAGMLTFTIEGQNIVLLEDDLLIETARKPGFVAESAGDLTVVLDTYLTAELLEEGFVREIVSKVQTMRKEAGFEVMDSICFAYGQNERIAKIVLNNADRIRRDTLSVRLQADIPEDEGFYRKDWNLNGEAVTFGVKRVQA